MRSKAFSKGENTVKLRKISKKNLGCLAKQKLKKAKKYRALINKQKMEEK